MTVMSSQFPRVLSLLVVVLLAASIWANYPTYVYAGLHNLPLSRLIRPVDINDWRFRIKVVTVGDRDYLYLGLGIFYPLDQIASELGIEEDRFRLVSDRLYTYRVPIIIRYSDGGDQYRIIDEIIGFGGVVDYVFKLFPYISARVPLANVSKLMLTNLVYSVMPDYMVRLDLNESVPMILPSEEFRRLESRLGVEVNGSGIVIGILDTGVDWNHPDFYFPNGTSKIIYNVSFVPGESPADGFGHGTHVAGIAAGTGRASGGKFRGVAPGALLANIKVLANNGTGYTSWILRGIEYAINESIDVINLSLGGGYNGVGDDPLSLAVDRAFDNGVVVVVAAGNEGPKYNSVAMPAVSRKAITVGAIYKNWSIVDFSSRGPTGDSRVKPDVLAPGYSIFAPLAGDSYLEELFTERFPSRIVYGDGGNYIPLSGTSMAAPHVAGLAALVLQLHPDYTPEEVKGALLSTARPTESDPFVSGLGIVDGVAALNTSTVFIDANIGYSGDPGIISLNFRIRELSGNAHSLQVGEVSLYDFYGGLSNLSRNILSLEAPPVILPRETNLVNLTLKIENLSLYYGYIRLLVDNEYNISAVYSIGILSKLITNITIDRGYLDGIFIAYEPDVPDRIYLPSGYKYYEDGGFRYYAWFNLPPGNYTLLAIGLNDSDTEYIVGPLYIGSREVLIGGSKRVYNIPFGLDGASISGIPRSFSDGIELPYFTITSIEIARDKSITLFLGGLWDINNDTRVIFSHEAGNKIYLNIQYLVVPRYFDENPYDFIDYIMDYYSVTWSFSSNPESLSVPPLSTYYIDTASQLDGDVMYGGLAVFPPHMDYTYIIITPLYQGGEYRVNLNVVAGMDRVGLVSLDRDKIAFRSVVVFDPATDLINRVRILAPPYMPSTVVRSDLFDNGTPYINITSLLATSIEATNVIADGVSRQEIFFNGSLIYSSSEEDDFNIHGYTLRKLGHGVYRVRSQYNLSYPMYSWIESELIFDTTMGFIPPPTLIRANIPIVVSSGYVISISFLSSGDIRAGRMWISWDDGNTWESLDVSMSSTNLFLFNLVTLYAKVDDVRQGMASLKIYVRDEYGSIYTAVISNAMSSEYLGFYNTSLDILSDRDIYWPGEYVSLNISYLGGLFATPLYINKTQILNILVNGSGFIILKDVYSQDIYGKAIFEAKLGYNVLYEEVPIQLQVVFSDLVFRGLKVDLDNYIELGNLSAMIVADFGEELNIYIDVGWVHNGSSYTNLLIALGNGSVMYLDDGVIRLSSPSRPMLQNISIKHIYAVLGEYERSIGNFSGYNISIAWDIIDITFEPVGMDRVQANRKLWIEGYASYRVLKEPFNGYIYVSGSRYSVVEGVFKISFTSPEPGLHILAVDSIDDPIYSVKVFESDTINIILDYIEVDVSGTYRDDAYIVTVNLTYESDGEPVADAVILVNGTRAEYIGGGSYRAVIKSGLPSASFIVDIEKEGFDIQRKVIEVEGKPSTPWIDYGILVLPVILVVAVAILLWIVKRKD